MALRRLLHGDRMVHLHVRVGIGADGSSPCPRLATLVSDVDKFTASSTYRVCGGGGWGGAGDWQGWGGGGGDWRE